MIQFNSDHIIVGQIKQLLAEFNLPTYRVYTLKNSLYHAQTNTEKDIIESIPLENITQNDTILDSQKHIRYIDYIKDDKIQRYYNGTWHDTLKKYYYNKKELNYTKNLKIQNNIYDAYTHEYLGNYLRFQRDYNNLNLMPFYNCFSNTLVPNLNYNWVTPKGVKVSFYSSDTRFKIYMLPVKLFQEYTIAIDCADGLELCCGVYGQYQDTRVKLKSIPGFTYKKINSASFSSPFLYSELTNLYQAISLDSAAELATIEQDLKLFIKLPANNTSTIVILEGNYIGWNDKYVEGNTVDSTKIDNPINFTGNLIKKNKIVNNYEEDLTYHPDMNSRIWTPITPLQLLQMNTGQQYPFSNRLTEFLTGNMITNIDQVSDNIKRIQTIMKENGNNITVDGLWSQKMQMILYDFVNLAYTRNKLAEVDKVDSIGYGDKDIESHYNSIKATTDADNNFKIDTVINTLQNINLYEDAFRNTYKGGKK